MTNDLLRAELLLETNQALNSIKNFLGSVQSDAQKTGKSAGESIANGINSEAKNLKLGDIIKANLISGFALDAIKGAIGSIGGFFNDQFKSATGLETTRLALNGLLGDSKKAGTVLKEVVKFAAETPFEIPELADTAKLLAGYGVSADNIVPSLKALGDAAAGTGSPIGQLARNFAQIQTQGKAGLIDLRQFAGAGVPIFGQLQKTLGKTKDEIEDMASSGKITSAIVQQAFQDMSKEGGTFFNAMKNQSSSVSGRLSTLSDTLGGLGRKILGLTDTGEIIPNSIFDNASKGIQGLVDGLSNPAFVNFASTIGGSISNAISGITQSLSKVDIGAFSNAITTAFSSIDIGSSLNGLKESFNFALSSQSVKNLLSIIQTTVQSALPFVASLSKAFLEFGSGVLSGLVPTIANFIGAALNGLKVAFEVLKPVIDFITPSLKNLGVTVGIFGGIVAGMVIKQALLNSIMGAWSGVMAFYTAVTTGAIAPTTLLGTAISLLTSPLALVGLAVTALVIIWQNNFFGIQEITYGVINNISTTVQSWWSSFIGFIEPALNSLSLIWNSTLGFLGIAWNDFWNGLASFIQPIWANISNIVNSGIKSIQSFFGGQLGQASNKWISFWSNLVAFVQPAFNTVSGFIQSGLSTISSLFGGLVSIVTPIWNELTNLFNNPIIQTSIGFLNGSIELLKTALGGLGQDANTKQLVATITSQFPVIGQIIGGIVKHIDILKNAFVGFASGIGNIFGSINLSGIFDGLFTLDFGKLSVEFGKVGTAVGNELGKLQLSVPKFFGDIFANLSLPDIDLPFIGNIKIKFDELKTYIGVKWSEITAFFSQSFVMPQFITDLINGAKSLGAEFQKIIPALQQFGSFILSMILPPLTQLGNFIMTTIVPALQQFATWVISNIIPALTALWNFVAPILIPALQIIGAIIGTVIVVAIAAVVIAIGVFIAILAGIVFIIGVVISGISMFVNAVVGFFTGLWTNLVNIWNTITTAISTAWTTISTFITNGLKTLGDIWNNFWTGVWNFVVNIFAQIYLSIWTKAMEIQFYITSWVNLIKAMWTTFWQGVWDKVVEIWTNLVTTVTTKATEVWNSIVKMKDDIIATIQGINLMELGQNMIQSLIDGVKNMAGALASAVGNIVSSALSGAKNLAGGGSGGGGDFVEAKRIAANAQGTKNWKGGLTTVAEEGRELIQLPNGSSFLANALSLLNLPKGTQIYSNLQTEQMIGVGAMANMSLPSTNSIGGNMGNTSNSIDNSQVIDNSSQVVNNYQQQSRFSGFGNNLNFSNR